MAIRGWIGLMQSVALFLKAKVHLSDKRKIILKIIIGFSMNYQFKKLDNA